MPANKHRGETEVELGGKTWLLRPTFQAIAEVESECDKNLQTLATEIAMGLTRAVDICMIIQAGIRATGKKPPELNEIGEWIIEAGGVVEVRESISDFFAGLISFYSGDAVEQSVAAGAKKKTPRKKIKT